MTVISFKLKLIKRTGVTGPRYTFGATIINRFRKVFNLLKSWAPGEEIRTTPKNSREFFKLNRLPIATATYSAAHFTEGLYLVEGRGSLYTGREMIEAGSSKY